MTVEKAVFRFAGFMVLLSLALAHCIHPVFFLVHSLYWRTYVSVFIY